jgi:hypothetical protein
VDEVCQGKIKRLLLIHAMGERLIPIQERHVSHKPGNIYADKRCTAPSAIQSGKLGQRLVGTVLQYHTTNDAPGAKAVLAGDPAKQRCA